MHNVDTCHDAVDIDTLIFWCVCQSVMLKISNIEKQLFLCFNLNMYRFIMASGKVHSLKIYGACHVYKCSIHFNDKEVAFYFLLFNNLIKLDLPLTCWYWSFMCCMELLSLDDKYIINLYLFWWDYLFNWKCVHMQVVDSYWTVSHHKQVCMCMCQGLFLVCVCLALSMCTHVFVHFLFIFDSQ